MLTDPANLDFRPRSGSPLIDAGETIKGITDHFAGKAPDIGAYEFGQPRWVPGYRNTLQILPSQDTYPLRLVLQMPTIEPVEILLNPESRAPGKIIFTPDNWSRPQPINMPDKTTTIGVSIPEFHVSETVNLSASEPATIRFQTIH